MYSVCVAPSVVTSPPVAGLSLREKDLEVRLARDEDDLRAAQRLRFEVFNLELRLGLAGSFASGLDRDAFDAHCDHLVVIDHRQKSVVGTYRLLLSNRTPSFREVVERYGRRFFSQESLA